MGTRPEENLRQLVCRGSILSHHETDVTTFPLLIALAPYWVY